MKYSGRKKQTETEKVLVKQKMGDFKILAIDDIFLTK